MRRNHCESLFEELATKNGWRTTKRGWPDFLCFHGKEVIAVEVKPRTRDGSRTQLLKRDQAACMDFLVSKGIRCFVSDGQTLEVYSREKHGSESLRRAARAKRLAQIGRTTRP